MNKIIIIIAVLAVLAGGVYYFGGFGKSVEVEKESSEIDDNISKETKEAVIEAKLEAYDIVMSKEPAAVRAMQLRLIELGEPEPSESLEDYKAYQAYEKNLIQSVPDEQLVSLTYNNYLEQYGSRKDFENDLRGAETKYTLRSDTNVNISLPPIHSMRNGVNDTLLRVLNAYYNDGRWY